MKKDTFIKLSLSEKQYSALDNYATLCETSKAGSVMHMIDICSNIGKYYNAIIISISKNEEVSKALNQVVIDMENDNKSQKDLINFYKLKGELTKLALLNKDWELENKVNWDFEGFNYVNKNK
jgi:hypothetical protein